MKTFSLLFPVVGVALFVTSCTVKSTEGKAEKARQVPVVELATIDTTVYKEYIADIQAARNVELRSRLSGFLEKIYVDEGATVKTGQVLFKVNDEEYKADYARAEAAFNIAVADAKKIELEKERTKKLVTKNIVSQTEQELVDVQHKAALSKVEEARALMNQARTRLGYTSIRAPFNGRIDRILLKEGSLLAEGSLLTSISDLTKLNVYFDISESEYLDLANDSTLKENGFKRDVKLILANGEEYPLDGKAKIVESEFEPTTGSISFRAQFPNDDGILKHGASGKIAVPISTGNTLMVHQKSVLEIQDKTYVYVLGEDDVVKMTPFINGPRVGHYYIVEEGISPDAKVVFEGVQTLRDGMRIKPRFVDKF